MVHHIQEQEKFVIVNENVLNLKPAVTPTPVQEWLWFQLFIGVNGYNKRNLLRIAPGNATQGT